MIYKKMNRLTSMCYPEYKGARERMKPPLTKFRLGELFGSESKEMTGFIKSLSFSFPDESPWETEQGKRVPKYITADIGFQVIHAETPSLRFTQKTGKYGVEFYGINQKIGVI